MKIALVHDFLKEYGGAERVLEALHEIWPEAPIFTSFVDWTGLGPHAERIRQWKIQEFTAFPPLRWTLKKLHSPLRFLLPLVWESFDFSGFDVVISSSGWGICRGIVTRPETVHICYLHHPPRHLYGYQTAYEWQKYWPIRVYGHLVNHYLRIYDYLAAQRVDYFIANSKETQRRIKKFYRRDSVVIYPPVRLLPVKLARDPLARVARSQPWKNLDNLPYSLRENLPFLYKFWKSITSKFSIPLQGVTSPSYGCLLLEGKSYFLCVSRLAKAKHIDLAIEACGRLGEPLVIVGKGREEKRLKAQGSRLRQGFGGQARLKVEFLGELSDEELPKIYQGAKALIFPAEDEEFGIVLVEAMSFGVPVIAYRSGGVKETVIEGKTGLFFERLSVDSLISKIKHFNNTYYRSEKKMKELAKNCQKQAKKFSQERFKKKILEFVEKVGF